MLRLGNLSLVKNTSSPTHLSNCTSKQWHLERPFRTTNSTPLSLSEQLLTAFAKLSYGKRDFAKAAGRKTENGEGKVRTVLKSPWILGQVLEKSLSDFLASSLS